MPLNHNYLCVYDFETGSPFAWTTEPIQLAAAMVHPRTLEIVEGSEFASYIRPYVMDNVTDDALGVGGKTPAQIQELREKIRAAPSRESVFGDFCAYLKRYTKGNQWGAPIPVGHNIINFDNIIIYRLCQEFKMLDKNLYQKIFHPFLCIDTGAILFNWWENLAEPTKYGMDTVRPYLGLDNSGGHIADKDVADSAAILIRFLKMQRTKALKLNFKGSMASDRV